MRPTKLGIEVTDNGVILTIKNNYDYNDGAPTTLVYEFDAENPDSIVELFYELRNAIGFHGGKYDKKRLAIALEHGDHYTCKEKNCGVEGCPNE